MFLQGQFRVQEFDAEMDPNECNSLLLSISDRLTGGDLKKMKFLLKEKLPEGKLENLQLPFELFRLMMNAQLLSADNLGPLASLLESAGRSDLSIELMQHVSKLKSAHEGAQGKRQLSALHSQSDRGNAVDYSHLNGFSLVLFLLTATLLQDTIILPTAKLK